MSTPTPRTDAAWSASFEPCEYRAAHTARTMRDCSQQLETELSVITAERDQLRARAERAEANETVALAHWNKELERAMKAEAELATERARRDDLVADINDACITLASAKDDCDDYALLNTGFKLTAVRDVLIQYIPNAAMKEGAK